jgi:hypothetical protein
VYFTVLKSIQQDSKYLNNFIFYFAIMLIIIQFSGGVVSVVPPPKTVTNFGVPEFFDPEAAAVNNEAPVSNDVDVFSSPNSSIIGK